MMTESGGQERDRAEIIAPPPVIFVLLLSAGLLLHWAYPVNFLPHLLPVRLILGLPFLIISGFLAVTALLTMRRTGTSPDPYNAATAVTVSGPYAYTRNPMYISLILLHCAISILLNALWSIMMVPLLFLLLRKGVVLPEERYLEDKFSETYLKYKKNVRRWI